MNILITGGAGFIGSHLVDTLLKMGDRTVVAIDNFDPFYDTAIKKKNLEQAYNYDNFKFFDISCLQ